ncbi:hypothetical protein NBRC10512_002801 [Rhodotorula toruloides]|uniref:ER membrane protein complex subunit 4 n=2 Tax=Rhodotorula toruloides TaxID=5286 RepID=A0A061B766_RHOTO|nr:ER membrane DUF1077 domain protein [Rhodotorula toruloides NP11]EMS21621.1 ER membrane DUF1077 domain protein [Rhodotorula toruloides NP11]KAJ8292485.1 ER membrane protein complex subunit 4 [Rhodotorula toruloides]CDR45749.1 RHTO0S11e04126g1_1 [Rhodotorula toruloides]
MDRWTLDYTATLTSKTVKVADPPGFAPALAVKPSTKNATSLIKPSPVDLDALRQQKAWELAFAPAKNVPMQAFMMYMTGGGIQIFSIMSVWFLFKQAFGGMMGVQQVFAPFDAAVKAKAAHSKADPPSFLFQKVVYVLCQFALVAVGLWKCRSMGILPDSAADWAPLLGRPVAPPVQPLGIRIEPLTPGAAGQPHVEL